jgi:hypothetical protein
MRKEVTVTHEILACDVCGRTILKGERTEPYLVQDGSRKLVCELCMRRAESAGWIREAARADLPTAPPGSEPRPSLLERLRSLWRSDGAPRRSRPGRVEVGMDGDERVPAPEPAPAEPVLPYEDPYPATGAEVAPPGASTVEEPPPAEGPAPVEELRPLEEPPPEEPPLAEPAPVEEALDPGYAEYEAQLTDPDDPDALAGAPGEEFGYDEAEPIPPDAPAPLEPPRGMRRRMRDPRHVRAVPTNAEVKVERALEVFNYSDYRRTVEGLVRTLGEPWVTAVPVLDSTSEVVVVVAWELSWYQYRIDLGDSDDPVVLTHKGKELDELDVTLREWNAVADAEGALALAAPRGE